MRILKTAPLMSLCQNHPKFEARGHVSGQFQWSQWQYFHYLRFFHFTTQRRGQRRELHTKCYSCCAIYV